MPLGESMITTLRNNKLINLNREDRFASANNGSNKTKLDFDNLPKSTPDTIRRIQEKIKRENKLRQQKRLLLIGLFVVFLFSVYIML